MLKDVPSLELFIIASCPEEFISLIVEERKNWLFKTRCVTWFASLAWIAKEQKLSKRVTFSSALSSEKKKLNIAYMNSIELIACMPFCADLCQNPSLFAKPMDKPWKIDIQSKLNPLLGLEWLYTSTAALPIPVGIPDNPLQKIRLAWLKKLGTLMTRVLNLVFFGIVSSNLEFGIFDKDWPNFRAEIFNCSEKSMFRDRKNLIMKKIKLKIITIVFFYQ